MRNDYRPKIPPGKSTYAAIKITKHTMLTILSAFHDANERSKFVLACLRKPPEKEALYYVAGNYLRKYYIQYEDQILTERQMHFLFTWRAKTEIGWFVIRPRENDDRADAASAASPDEDDEWLYT